MLWKLLSKTCALSPVFIPSRQFTLITLGQCLLIIVIECHCLNVPFGFVSHFGMLIMCKWPKLNLGTGGPPICI